MRIYLQGNQKYGPLNPRQLRLIQMIVILRKDEYLLQKEQYPEAKYYLHIGINFFKLDDTWKDSSSMLGGCEPSVTMDVVRLVVHCSTIALEELTHIVHDGNLVQLMYIHKKITRIQNLKKQIYTYSLH